VGKYLDILKRAGAQSAPSDISDQSDGSYFPCDQDTDFGRLCRFGRAPQPYCQLAIEALERRCPAYVEHDRWRQAIDDAHRFFLDGAAKPRRAAGRSATCSAWRPYPTNRIRGIGASPATMKPD
jgi:hypothetical protein